MSVSYLQRARERRLSLPSPRKKRPQPLRPRKSSQRNLSLRSLLCLLSPPSPLSNLLNNPLRSLSSKLPRSLLKSLLSHPKSLLNLPWNLLLSSLLNLPLRQQKPTMHRLSRSLPWKRRPRSLKPSLRNLLNNRPLLQSSLRSLPHLSPRKLHPLSQP